MSVSLWRYREDEKVECDAVVIGGGICGISAALHLQRRGLRPIVLEQGGLGSGASSRNAGFLIRGAAENYAAAIRAYGRPTARLIWRWSEENLAGLREEGVQETRGYAARPSCLLAWSDDEHQELRESLQLLHDDGFAAEWMEAGDDDAWRNTTPLGALVNPGDAVCHPLNVLEHLAGRLQHPLQEHAEVFDIRESGPGADLLTVRTTRARFITPHVLLCTNAWAPLLARPLDDLITPRRGQMLAVRTAVARLDFAYYANFGYEYFRQVDEQTVILGGCRREVADVEVGYEDRTTEQVQSRIEQLAARVLGIRREDLCIPHRWSGTMGFSHDGLPLVGPLDGPWRPGGVVFCGGFTGHGMSLAYRMARSAVEVLLDGLESPLALSRVNPPGSKVIAGRGP